MEAEMETHIEVVSFSYCQTSFELIRCPGQPKDVLVQELLRDGEEGAVAMVPNTTPARLATFLRSRARNPMDVKRLVTGLGLASLGQKTAAAGFGIIGGELDGP